MFSKRRHRRGPYALAGPTPARGVVATLIGIILLFIIVLFIGWQILSWLGMIGSMDSRSSVQLRVEGNGAVSVAIDGGKAQQARESLPLYPGDAVTTGVGGKATLQFPRGMIARMDEQSDVVITESTNTEKRVAVGVQLNRGKIWVRSMEENITATGSIVRVVNTPSFQATIPASTDALIGTGSIYVFRAQGLGIVVLAATTKQSIYVGEGQQFEFPSTGESDRDLYAYRSPLDEEVERAPFVLESRSIFTQQVAMSSGIAIKPLLTVMAPLNGAVVEGLIVQVTGSVSEKVSKIRMNGYAVNIDKDQNFSQELVFEDNGESLEIRTEALDERGIILAQDQRTVRRTNMKKNVSAGLPTIVSPGKSGETVSTLAASVTISGTVPEGTVSVYVNDYKLQLFKEGSTTWQYIARLDLGNFKEGTNVYEVIAVDADGNRSAPARLTIQQGTAARSSAEDGPNAPQDESLLPKNAPLNLGSLVINEPKAGTMYAATESGVLLAGTTSPQTASVWVNGYKLQLYKPGRTAWNYIASEELGNLKKGTNVYVVNARDSDDKIIDSVTYTITH